MYEIINIYKGRAGQRSAVRGFTLVEVALSLLVISVGIVVLVGLFPAGLKANKASIDETRMALFAEEVLNGVRAASRDIPWDWLVNDGPFFSLPAPAPDIWSGLAALLETAGAGRYRAILLPRQRYTHFLKECVTASIATV